MSTPDDRPTPGTAGPTVHPTATVEDGASLGPGTRVWHQAHVRTGARVGADVVLGKNVFVDADVRIGDRTKVQNNVSVYAGVTLEDEVFVGPGAVFTNDLRPRAVADSWEVVPTVVRQGASVGGGAVVVCGTEIGRWAMVAAGSVVTRSVPDHALVVGNPARLRGWVCACGEVASREERRPADPTCTACRKSGSAVAAGGRSA